MPLLTALIRSVWPFHRPDAVASSGWTAVGVVCLALAACSSPTGIQFTESTTAPLQVSDILVATSRERSSDADFGSERGDGLAFASYGVSVPKGHKVGQIEWPRDAVNPKLHFAVVAAQTFKGPDAFVQQLNQRLSAPGARTVDNKREVALFVHGYNTDFSESLYRAAQMKHDFEMPMPLMLFSWPSAGKPELYMYDRDSVKASRDHLATVIDLLTTAHADQVTLIAHSMGTELLMESLRQLALSQGGRLPAKIKSVILISPDLDIDVFNSQLDAIKRLPQDFFVFASQKDQALKLSSLLAGDRQRVGNSIDETKIRHEGIRVIDVSDFTGGDDFNHMTAVTAPGLVALLKTINTTYDKDFLEDQGEKSSLSDLIIDTASAPVTLVVKTTKAIFDR